MREIKFRYLLKNIITRQYCTAYFTLDEIELGDAHSYLFNMNGYVLVSRDQYTGLRDKNGTEIYDGDIVHIDDSYLNDRSHNNLGVIGAFDDSQYLWRVHADLARVGVHGKESYYLSHSTMILEVVGNIYENPDLLEAEK